MTRAACALFLLALWPGAPLSAQETRTVHGRVLDASTSQPVVTAVVRSEQTGRAAITDTLGQFTLLKVPAVIQRLVVSRIGYQELDVAIDSTETEPLTINLVPQPIPLAAITAVFNTLERRRERIAQTVQVFDARQLALATQDLRQFLRTRGVPLVKCPSGGGVRVAGDDCLLIRGQYRPLRVYLDEVNITGMQWDTWFPTEYELIEYYARSATVRLYTAVYLEKVAQGKAILSEIVQ
jgi:hypothetical protein